MSMILSMGRYVNTQKCALIKDMRKYSLHFFCDLEITKSCANVQLNCAIVAIIMQSCLQSFHPVCKFITINLNAFNIASMSF